MRICIFLLALLFSKYSQSQLWANFSFSDNCSNKILSFSNTSSAPASIVAFQWHFGDSLNSSSNIENPSFDFKHGGNFQVKLKIVLVDGRKDSIIKNVEVFGIYPKLIFVEKPCTEDSSILKLNYFGTINKHNWYVDDTKIGEQNNKKYKFKFTAVFSIASSIISTNGCRDSISNNIFIGAGKPKANFSISGKCVKDIITFKNTSTQQSGYSLLKQEWTFSDGTTATDLQTLKTFNTENTYRVVLKVFSSGGCYDTLSKQFFIALKPKSNFTFDPLINKGDSIQCFSGNQFGFVNTSIINHNSIYSKKGQIWKINGIQVDTNYNFKTSFATGGYKNIVLIVENNFACKDSIMKIVDLKAPINLKIKQLIPCFPSPVSFFDSSYYSGGFITSRSWNINNVFFSTKRTFDFEPDTKGILNVKLKVTSDAGCTDSLIQAYNYNDKPTLNIISNKGENVCKGQIFTLKAKYNSGKIVWSNGEKTDSITSKNGGKYIATASVTPLCFAKDSIQIKIIPLPIPFAGNDTSVLINNIFGLNGKGKGIPKWYPEQIFTINNTLNPKAKLIADEIIVLSLTDSFGCIGYDTLLVKVKEIDHLIPNIITPNADGFNDIWDISYISSNSPCNVKIVNGYGETVFESENYQNNWDATIADKVLPSGTYFYFITETKDNGNTYKGFLEILR